MCSQGFNRIEPRHKRDSVQYPLRGINALEIKGEWKYEKNNFSFCNFSIHSSHPEFWRKSEFSGRANYNPTDAAVF